MSAPTKPKSGGVNLFLTRRDVGLLRIAVEDSIGRNNGGWKEAFRDLLTVIQSQSKGADS